MEICNIDSSTPKPSYYEQGRSRGSDAKSLADSAKKAQKKKHRERILSRKPSKSQEVFPEQQLEPSISRQSSTTLPIPSTSNIDSVLRHTFEYNFYTGYSPVNTPEDIYASLQGSDDEEMPASTSQQAAQPIQEDIPHEPTTINAFGLTKQNFDEIVQQAVIHALHVQQNSTSTKDLKFAEPKTYSGKPEDLDDFINDCELIFSIKGDIYDEDAKKSLTRFNS